MVFYTLTVIFSYVSTKWVVPENIHTPLGGNLQSPLPLYGHPAQIQDILHNDFPLPLWTVEISSVSEVWFFFGMTQEHIMQ